MQLKIRKENKDGVVRMETSGELKEILINEDVRVKAVKPITRMLDISKKYGL